MGQFLRLVSSALIILTAYGTATAEPWRQIDPASSGWSMPKLAIAEQEVKKLGPVGFVVIHNSAMVAGWGDTASKINVASVRKSLLSALFGIKAASGEIKLDSTLAELGIDDKSGLSAQEKSAKVIDLLKARSGVYHPAAYESAEMTASKPARGTSMPGAAWHYNNWDFNALGTIYRKATGEDIFASFEQRIAKPLGMEDFAPGDGRYVTEALSIHPAYPFMMSARDLARFGQLYLDGGRWGGKQIIPADWVGASLTSYSETDRRDRGYGYMWWILDPSVYGPGAGLAAGNGGHLIAVIPSKRLVVAETADRRLNGGVRTGDFLAVLRLISSAAP